MGALCGARGSAPRGIRGRSCEVALRVCAVGQGVVSRCGARGVGFFLAMDQNIVVSYRLGE